jgi:hypothetical protein
MSRKSSTKIRARVAIGLIALLFLPSGSARADNLTNTRAAVKYFGDATGSFTLNPPLAENSYYLPLTGTSVYRELMIKILKKNSGRPARQIIYRMNNRTEFNLKYLLKDGMGDYEVSIFGKQSARTRTYAGLCAFTIRSDRMIPEKFEGMYVNDKVLAFVDTVIGNTVGSGECWDLAQEALDTAGADWTRPVQFGRLLDPELDEIKTGDIIQFRSVRLKAKLSGGVTRYESLGNPDHTAVIYGIEGKNIYRIANQNAGGKRFVIISRIDMNTMTSGTYWIYRPIAAFMQ